MISQNNVEKRGELVNDIRPVFVAKIEQGNRIIANIIPIDHKYEVFLPE